MGTILQSTPIDQLLKGRIARLEDGVITEAFIPMVTWGEMQSWFEEPQKGLGLGTLLFQGKAKDSPTVSVAGEVIVMDGRAFCTPKIGNEMGETYEIVDPDTIIAFAQVTHFVDSVRMPFVTADNPKNLIGMIQNALPKSQRGAFVARISGTFDEVLLRTAGAKEGDIDPPLSDILAEKIVVPVHDSEMGMNAVLIYVDEGIVSAEITPSGWHMHCHPHDKPLGGHVEGFSGLVATIDAMPVEQWLLATRQHVNDVENLLPNSLLTQPALCWENYMDKEHIRE